ncbi:MAG: radical SAM protein [Litoreibacter sp.]|nr:radical SAM protein [Litoreibacter sp.]
MRKQIMELDTLAWPDRADIPYEETAQPTAAILGSRGCPWNCDFCSIRPFYEAQEGSLRRLRSPRDVMEEMRHLYHDRSVSLFLFQDDDFLATRARARNWAGELSDLIAESDIGGNVSSKMSCRSDELRPDIIARMVRGGLTHVYMGVESGDVQGLKNMNKMMSPQKHLDAGHMLRAAGLSFDFGFMLMDPWSDFRMIRANAEFLDAFVGDGWSVAGFCRMLPYSGTPVERKLKAEGRLEGSGFEPDYKFLDPKLDRFYAWMLETFHTRNFTNEGLAHLLRAMLFESRLQSERTRWMTSEETRWLQFITARANRSAVTTVLQAVDYFERTPLDEIVVYDGLLAALTARELEEQAVFTHQVERFWSDPGRQARRKARHESLLGGFERSWTFEGPAAWETLGVGVR